MPPSVVALIEQAKGVMVRITTFGFNVADTFDKPKISGFESLLLDLRLLTPLAASGGEILGEETVVVLAALGRTVPAEIMVLAVEREDGLSGGLVEAVGRDSCRHGGAPDRHNPVDYRVCEGFWAALPDAERCAWSR
jgi:hypothetical protein